VALVEKIFIGKKDFPYFWVFGGGYAYLYQL
jgi:hypothetical protein